MNHKINKLLVIGGTGRTGNKIIEKLLQKNYFVTSLTRQDPIKCKYYGENHTWAFYNIYSNHHQKKNLTEILKGHSGIISALGRRDDSHEDLFYKSYKNLIPAMESSNVNRLVMITDAAKYLDKLPKDTEKAENFFKNEYKGKVNWTIVRPFRLMLEGELGTFRVQVECDSPKDNKLHTKSHTGDVAELCIQIYEKDLHKKQIICTGE